MTFSARWDAFLIRCLKVDRPKALAMVTSLVAFATLADWAAGEDVSLSLLYAPPMIVGAIAFRPLEIAALAVICSCIRSVFDSPSPPVETLLRFVFATTAYLITGLFVMAVVRNRQQTMEHLARIEREQALRREAEDQLVLLVESSPAAILTMDGDGTVVAANRAAQDLFSLPDGASLLGRSIERYLPLLSDALRLETGEEGFRTAAQCQGRRESGEIFVANTWFSSYNSARGARLAAIVVDTSDEMRDREEQNLRQLHKYNEIAAAAVSHEVRNLSSSIVVLLSSLCDKHRLAGEDDYQRLLALVQGLERASALNLRSRASETFDAIPLRAVLDNLRIMIEPGWLDAGASLFWNLPDTCPNVVADPQGLLQACLNLAQNSLRAIETAPVRRLTISVSTSDQRAWIRFEDSGSGISDPERLFVPFQPGAEGTGLGLFISRALVRGYGGDLCFEPRALGTSFVIALQVETPA